MQTSFSVVRMNGNMEVYEYRDTLLWSVAPGSSWLTTGLSPPSLQKLKIKIHYFPKMNILGLVRSKLQLDWYIKKK